MIENKRLAICLSGVPKLHNFSVESIRRYFNNADIFIHCWQLNLSDNPQLDRNDMSGNPSRYFSYNDLTEKQLVDTYNPKKYKIESFSDKYDELKIIKDRFFKNPNKHIGPWAAATSLVSMYYSIYHANKLKTQYELKNNFTYDLVIRMRFDSQVFDWNDEYFPTDDTLVVPKYSKVPEEPADYLNDQFWIGNSSVMNKVCDIFNHLEELDVYHPEMMLRQYVRDFIKVKLDRIDMYVSVNGYAKPE